MVLLNLANTFRCLPCNVVKDQTNECEAPNLLRLVEIGRFCSLYVLVGPGTGQSFRLCMGRLRRQSS